MSDLAVEVRPGLVRYLRMRAHRARARGGVGNIGLRDDGFGVEVVQRLRSTRT